MNKNNAIANRNEVDSFDDIYASLKNKVFNFVYRMAGNRAIAEDITQETFLRVYKNYRNFKGKSKLSTWIFAIAKNVCFRQFKNNKKSNFQSLEGLIKAESGPNGEDQYNALEKSHYINQVKEGCLLGLLRCLPFHQRVSFILNVLIDIPVKDVSDIINKSENSTRILIFRARDKLKKFLCDNCSLFDGKNQCKCENLISFSLKRNWIKKYNPTISQNVIEVEVKELKSEIALYKTLNTYDFNLKISEIMNSQKYLIFTGKKVK